MKKVLAALTVGFAVAACGGAGDVGQDEPVSESASALRGQFCGGIAGISCPTGYTCVDDPRDSCDPNSGGADCGGVCVKQRACSPKLKYVSRDPSQCAAMLFLCEPGREPFFNTTGCGCACEDTVVSTCDDPARTYVSHDPAECALIRYSCTSGVGFSDSCGCGCIN